MKTKKFASPFLLLILVLLQLCPSWAEGALPQEILQEVNLLRTQPKKYAEILRQERKFYVGNSLQKPGEVTIRLNEGVKALDEAIEYLDRQEAVPALKLSAGMCLGSQDHVKDQQSTGKTGHSGGDGTLAGERIQRYGSARGSGENLAYGYAKARDIVIQLVVDDGVADRGHRTNFFRPNWQYMGSAVGAHPSYRHMCAITFAVDYVEDSSRQAGRNINLGSSSNGQTSINSDSNDGRTARTTEQPKPRSSASADSRAIAERCLQLGLNQDNDGVRQCLTTEARGRASIYIGRMSRDLANGVNYRFSRSRPVGTYMVQLTFEKLQNGKATPFSVTTLREGNTWLVDDITE